MAAEHIDDVERFVTSEPERFGMLLFVISEATFFAFLIIAYVYLHGSMVKSRPNATTALDPLRTGLFTVALLGSSFTMARAEKHQAQGRPAQFRRWLAVTVVLGIIFLIGQATEYLHLYATNVTISRNVFGTAFFTLTGFHGLHVLMGLILLGVLFGLALAGSFDRPNSRAVRVIALYWHFVDWVWVVIFAVVYLWAAL